MKDHLLYLGIIVILSGLLCFLLAFKKKYSKIWGILGGIVLSVPIIMIGNSLTVFIKIKTEFKLEIVAGSLLVLIYLFLFIFLKKSELSPIEKKRREAVEEALTKGFLYLKLKQYNDAYTELLKGLAVDNKNQEIKRLLKYFDESGFQYKAPFFLTIKLRVKLFANRMSKRYKLNSFLL